MKTTLSRRIHLLFIMSLVVVTCKKKEDSPVIPVSEPEQIGSFKIQAFKELITKEIPTSGGTITVGGTNTPIDGMVLDIPSESYAESKKISISAGEILEQNLGTEYSILSPMINVTNISGYTKGFLKLSIPIKLPSGYFAAVAYFDQQNKLDLLPVISLTNDQIVVATNTLEPYQWSKNGRISATKGLKFFVVGVKESLLNEGVFSTSYKIGQDDWAFPNWGSSIAPNGFCLGASYSSLWYLTNAKISTGKSLSEQGKAPNAPLGLDTKKMWFSYSLGIKYASVLQKAKNETWEGIASSYKLLLDLTPKGVRDKFTYLFASLYLKIVQKPLFLAVWRNGSGHAILIIGKKANGLELADPNFPGEQRPPLTYTQTTGLGKYVSGSVADDTRDYDTFAAWPPFVLLKDATAEEKWREVENGTIGNGIFPSFSYSYVTDGGSISLKQTGNSVFNKFKIVIDGNNGFISKLYDSKGDTIKRDANGFVLLPAGDNKVGVSVGQYQQIPTLYRSWSDFQWFDIKVETLNITTTDGIPITKDGEPNKEYTFYTEGNWKHDANTIFEWDFGDGSAKKRVVGDNKAKYTYTKSGTFNIELKIINGVTVTTVTTLKTIAKIQNPNDYYFYLTVNGSEYRVDGVSSTPKFNIIRGQTVSTPYSSIAIFPKDFKLGELQINSVELFISPYYGTKSYPLNYNNPIPTQIAVTVNVFKNGIGGFTYWLFKSGEIIVKEYENYVEGSTNGGELLGKDSPYAGLSADPPGGLSREIKVTAKFKALKTVKP